MAQRWSFLAGRAEAWILLLLVSVGGWAVEAAAIQFSPEENASESASVSGLSEVSPQAVVADRQGRVIVVWAEFADASAPPELWMNIRQPDSGWGSPVAVTPADGEFSGDAAIALDSKGQPQLVWVDKRSGTLEVWVAGLDLERKKLIDSQAISSGAQLVMDPAIAVGPGGELAVAWTAMESMNYEIKLRRRSAPGPWSAVENVTPPDRHASDQVAIAYGADGRLTIAWADNREGMRRILVAVRGPSGLTPPVEVSTTEKGKQTRPSMALGRGGEVVLAWQDSREGDKATDDAVYLARSSDGKAFGPARRIAGGAASGARKERSGPAHSPCVVLAADGVAHLLWEGGELGQPGGEESSVQIHYARLAGDSLADERTITTDRPISCTNPSAFLDATGNLHLVWVNHGIGEGDIMYRQAAPGAQAVPAAATNPGG